MAFYRVYYARILLGLSLLTGWLDCLTLTMAILLFSQSQPGDNIGVTLLIITHQIFQQAGTQSHHL